MKTISRRTAGLAALLLALILSAAVGCGGAEPAATTAGGQDTTTTTAASQAVQPAGANQVVFEEVVVPEPTKKYVIGAAMVSGGEPFQESVVWAIKDEAAKYGAEVIVVDAGGYGNAAKQASQVEDLVQRGVDAIIMWPVSYEGSASVIDAAVAAGVPVITVVTPSQSENVSAWVGVDDVKIGQILAEYHGEALGGSGQVALINGGEGAAWSKFRADGYVETMKAKFPNIEVVDQRWTPNLDPGTALSLAEDLLLKFPGLKGIYSTTTGMAFGVSQAVEDAGRSGEVKLAGSAIQGKDDIDLLKSGTVAVVTGEPAIITGRWGLAYTLKVLAGEDVPPFVEVPTPVYTEANVGQADFSLELAPNYLQ